MPAIQQLSELAKRAEYYTDRYGRVRQRTSNPARYAALSSLIGLFFILMILYACMSRRRLNRGYKPYYGTTWVLRKPTLAGKKTAQRAEKVAYGQSPEINYDSRPNNNQDYAPPSSPPPAHTNHSTYGAGDQNSGTYYPPPQNPPPNSSGANEYYPPPQGPPPTYDQSRK